MKIEIATVTIKDLEEKFAELDIETKRDFAGILSIQEYIEETVVKINRLLPSSSKISLKSEMADLLKELGLGFGTNNFNEVFSEVTLPNGQLLSEAIEAD